MAIEGREIRNDVDGVVLGPVVQAGSIQHVSLAGGELYGALPVPRQLPPAVKDFTGRAAYLEMLDKSIPAAGDGDIPAQTVVISALGGTAGVGKTALAVYWAHRVQDRFNGGTLFANLRGYGPGEPAAPGEILNGFLHALGVIPERIPMEVDARAGLYRSLLHGRRVLVVLDNASAAEQVRPLLPGSPGCLVLVTSRDALSGLRIRDAASTLTLPPLGPEEAYSLVSAIIGTQRARAESDAVLELASLCSRLPIALRNVGSRIAGRACVSIADVLADMCDDSARMDTLSAITDNASVRVVFGWSYQKVTEEQAELFRQLGLHRGPEISSHVAAAVAGLPLDRTRRLLGQLSEVHLIEPIARDRFEFHDLWRLYAAEQAQRCDSGESRKRAIRRMLIWYVYATAKAHRIAFPAYVHRPFDLGAQPGALPVMRTRDDGLRWLRAEHANVVAAIQQAAEHGSSQLAVLLVEAFETFLYHQAAWDQLFDACNIGMVAARDANDRSGETWLLIRLGWARLQVFGWDAAVEHLERGLAWASQLRNPYLEAYARNDLGLGCIRRGRYTEALEYLRPAIALSEGTDRGRQEAHIHGNISSAFAGLGRSDRALEHAERSLVLRRRAGDCEGEVFTLNQLAQIWQSLGQHAKAITICNEAARIPREYAYQPDCATTLSILGASWLHYGKVERTIECWSESLRIYDYFADCRAPDLRRRLQALLV